MFTRKQQWRRTRTRKHAWGNLPPEVVEAMLAAGGGTGVPKSVSWDSYSVGLKSRAIEAADAARRAAREEDSLRAKEAAVAARAAKTSSARAATAAAAAAEEAAPALHIPRSVSCSSLAPKRTLFPRSSSRDGLGPSVAARRANTGRGRLLPRRRGVSFDTQVKMVLIPKREEFSDSERARLWWGRDDYANFRQVLIDWKRANVHRISNSDNILSIDLGDIDEDYEADQDNDRDHDETVAAVAAADATAAAAAAVAERAAAAAAAVSAAAAAATATAAATAVAAAAATAAEVAALDALERERSHRQGMAAAAREQAAAALERREQELEEAEAKENAIAEALGASLDARNEAAAAAAATAAETAKAMEAGESGGENVVDVIAQSLEALSAAGSLPECAVLSDIAEEAEERQGGRNAAESSGEKKKKGGKQHRPSTSFSVAPRARVGDGLALPDWSSPKAVNGAIGAFTLRRSFTFGQCSPPANHLKVVALSEAQATTESLRAWRKNFDERNALSSSDGDDGEEQRGRAVSLQQQTKGYASRGRATALFLGQRQDPTAAAADQANGGGGGGGSAHCGGEGGRSVGPGDGGGGVDEKERRTLSDQGSRTALMDTKASLTTPMMATFERQRREAEVEQEEMEAEQAGRASATVEAAAAAAAAAAAEVASTMTEAEGVEVAATDLEQKPSAKQGEHLGVPQPQGMGADGYREAFAGETAAGRPVVQLGLNDSPGSSALAAAAGIRMAADGVSNLSLRARDSVENLQELGERTWGPVPLSSSA